MTERLLYFDCSAGVSGDMTLGALVDLGLPLKKLTTELKKLRMGRFQLKASKAARQGIRGTYVRVQTPGDPGHRHFAEFARLIESSRLSRGVKERSLELIRRIYSAEARVHGKRIDKIHLHELGALDTLIDVVGSLVGLELLGIGAVESSPINVGGGEIQMEHGRMAAPAPATALLLRGTPVFSDGSTFERTTPTGALLVTGLAERFGSWPAMTVKQIGYGLGSKDPRDGRPNALRVILGEREARKGEAVLVMEATIDDMSPELAGYLLERLLEAGALDVFLTPVQMKKSRPGVNVTVLAPPSLREEMAGILFAESTTLGLRCSEVERQVLERKVVRVVTRFGKIAVKLGLSDGRVLNVAPEFEDCRRVASRKGVSLKEVQHAALAAWRRSSKDVG
jgi:uncharacterized protein (TIGR00299 family) protein